MDGTTHQPETDTCQSEIWAGKSRMAWRVAT
jgi:hypothetical protein